MSIFDWLEPKKLNVNQKQIEIQESDNVLDEDVTEGYIMDCDEFPTKILERTSIAADNYCESIGIDPEVDSTLEDLSEFQINQLSNGKMLAIPSYDGKKITFIIKKKE